MASEASEVSEADGLQTSAPVFHENLKCEGFHAESELCEIFTGGLTLLFLCVLINQRQKPTQSARVQWRYDIEATV